MSRTNQFNLEPLEPRIMLSGSVGVLACKAIDLASNDSAPFIQEEVQQDQFDQNIPSVEDYVARPEEGIFDGLEVVDLAVEGGNEAVDSETSEATESAETAADKASFCIS